jgi:hypothetical protein
MRPSLRLPPKLPVGNMQTYQILAPRATHFRPATCAEVDCQHYLAGWKSVIDESTDLGKSQAYFIRNQSGRHFREERNAAPGVTIFIFEAGQKCFSNHELRLDRPELYLVKGGDWRGNPTGFKRQHVNAEDWVDDFANHQSKIADAVQQG